MAAPAVLLPAGRIALGERREVAAILDGRTSEGEESSELIADLNTALASEDPQRTLASGTVQLRKGGARSGPYAGRAKPLEALRRSGKEELRSQVGVLRIQRRLGAEYCHVR